MAHPPRAGLSARHYIWWYLRQGHNCHTELDAKVRDLAAYGAPYVHAAGLITAVRGIADEADLTRLLRLTVPA